MKYEYKTVRAGDIASLNILGAVGWRVVPLGTLPGAWILVEKEIKPPRQKLGWPVEDKD